jgi:hypothetical protein
MLFRIPGEGQEIYNEKTLRLLKQASKKRNKQAAVKTIKGSLKDISLQSRL